MISDDIVKMNLQFYQVPPACGLPEELQNLYLATHLKNSPIMTSKTGYGGHDHPGGGQYGGSDGAAVAAAAARHGHHGHHGHHGGAHHAGPYAPYPDSSSNTSSCNSSTPSSPGICITCGII